MTVKTRRIILLLLALAVFAFFVWYTSPRTAEELFPNWNWDQITGMQGTYDRYEDSGHPAMAPIWIVGKTSEVITPDSETGQALLSLLKDVEYRRSLENLVPGKGGRSYGPLHAGDLDIYVRFLIDGAPGYLMVRYYYDEMIIHTAESKEYTCSATGQDYLAQELFSLLQPYVTEEIVE